jgi:hypothetical protein
LGNLFYGICYNYSSFTLLSILPGGHGGLPLRSFHNHHLFRLYKRSGGKAVKINA